MAIKKQNNTRQAFTLMELLVVIAIIMTLIGILVPGMKGVKRIAKNLEQKSLFHAIDIGLETYRKDFGDFPDSQRKDNGSLYYTGAQHLAEAMVGRDSRGLEPSQTGKWYWPGNEPANYGLYALPGSALDQKSLARRKPLYVNLKDTAAFLPGEIYASPLDPSVNSTVVSLDDSTGQRAPMITDMFFTKKVTLASGETVKLGSPILYYKANRRSKLFYKDASTYGPADFKKWKFNYNDNEQVIGLGTVSDPLVPHWMDPKDFYESINDPKAPQSSFPDGKPMNENSYILISAGYDGIFGTNPRTQKNDDITNIKIK